MKSSGNTRMGATSDNSHLMMLQVYKPAKRQAKECHRKHLLLATAGLCLIQLTALQECQAKQHQNQQQAHDQEVMSNSDRQHQHHSLATAAAAAIDSHSMKLLKRHSDVEGVQDLGAADIQVTTPVTAAPTCGYPGSPAHASVTFNTSQVVVGTASSYTCDNGYELLGPPRRLCQANGTWSPIGIPFCGKWIPKIRE